MVSDIPKILLHIHLDGSIDITDAYKWAREDGLNLSKDDLLKKLQVDEYCHSLNDYLEKFVIPCDLLQTCERLEMASYHLFLKLAKLNVLYAEVRLAPQKHLQRGLNLEDVIISVVNGMNKASVKTGIMGGIILCLMRGDEDKKNWEVLKKAKEYLHKGVVGIDLAGAEAIYPTKDYGEFFKYANLMSIPFTVHAGEAMGCESINQALEFKPRRLGHGIRAIEDGSVVEKLKKMDVLLEVCVTSNYQTCAIKGPHPVRKLYDAGVKISINTDNDMVSNIDINKEYEMLINDNLFTKEELVKCNIDSISYIMAQDEVKDKLKNYYKKYLDASGR